MAFILYCYLYALYRVFIAIWNKENAFFGQKNLFLKPNIFFLKIGGGTFMTCQKLCLKKLRTLDAWNHQFSSEEGHCVPALSKTSCSFRHWKLRLFTFKGSLICKGVINYDLWPPAPELDVKALKIIKLDVLGLGEPLGICPCWFKTGGGVYLEGGICPPCFKSSGAYATL